MGRLGRVVGTRELIINRTPYIAAYLVTKDAVIILRILHGAQRWPKKLVLS
jgi:toxin ParE1/3/4